MNRSLIAAIREVLVVFALAIIAVLVLTLAGCAEPTARSPRTGQELTAQELAAEQRRFEAESQADQDAAAAELTAALEAANASALAELASIKARFEPRIRAAADKVKLAAAEYTAALERIEAIKAQRAAAVGMIPSVLKTIGSVVPGWQAALGIVGGLVGTGATIFGVKAKQQATIAKGKLEQAASHLTTIVDAMDHANDATPAGDHDAAWDKNFSEWAAGSLDIIKRIGSRTDGRNIAA